MKKQTTLYYNNGKPKYIGEVNEKGEFHGKGKLYRTDGTLSYEGDFVNGEYHGEGKEYFKNGNLRYEGEWKDGIRHGKGQKYDKEGNLEYKGEFRNNMASKMSILTIKELKQAWKNYLFNGGEKIHFYIYEEKEIFGREIYTYQDKKGTHYLIINGINVLADVNACCCGYIGKGEFHYFLDPSTHKFGKFDFKTNTFKLDV